MIIHDSKAFQIVWKDMFFQRLGKHWFGSAIWAQVIHQTLLHRQLLCSISSRSLVQIVLVGFTLFFALGIFFSIFVVLQKFLMDFLWILCLSFLPTFGIDRSIKDFLFCYFFTFVLLTHFWNCLSWAFASSLVASSTSFLVPSIKLFWLSFHSISVERAHLYVRFRDLPGTGRLHSTYQ